MTELRSVQAQQVDQRCPVCQNGWMRPNGIISGSQFGHKCTACEYTASFPVRYPYIVQ